MENQVSTTTVEQTDVAYSTLPIISLSLAGIVLMLVVCLIAKRKTKQ